MDDQRTRPIFTTDVVDPTVYSEILTLTLRISSPLDLTELYCAVGDARGLVGTELKWHKDGFREAEGLTVARLMVRDVIHMLDPF